jgi:hypothetical protein
MILLVPLICIFWVERFAQSFQYDQPSATLWKDQLFVAIASKPLIASPMLYRGPFTPTPARIRSPIEHIYLYSDETDTTQAKIEVRDNRMLVYRVSGDHNIFRLEDVPLLENTAFGAKLREFRDPPVPEANPLLENDPDRIKLRDYARLTRLVDPYGSERWRLLLPDHRQADVPLSGGAKDDGDTPSERTYVNSVRHDVLIAGPKSVRLFHAYKDRFFVSVEPDCLNKWYLDKDGNVAKNLPKPPDRQLRKGKLPADFTEHFAAYTSEKRDYLVTPNGKVYMAAPKGKTELEVAKVWDDPKRKIVGVVQDQANDAVYGWGFVTDSAAPERFYVKMTPKPVAVEYKRTVPLWNDRSDAYLESYECARAFRKVMEKK